MVQLADISLRDKKTAKTKIALTNEFMDRLKSTSFDSISITDVCKKVEVSDGTFYNYFPQKIDILHYALQLSDLKMSWEIYKSKPKTALKTISYAFEYTASEFSGSHLLYEIIAAFLKERSERVVKEMSKAEKIIAFPECKGIDEVEPKRVEEVLYESLVSAKENKELPNNINVNEALTSLRTILVGVPLSMTFEELDKMGKEYKRQLDLLWKAIGK